jgi:hypothetical protein
VTGQLFFSSPDCFDRNGHHFASMILTFDVSFQISCYYYLICQLNLLRVLLFYLNLHLKSMMATQRKKHFLKGETQHTEQKFLK